MEEIGAAQPVAPAVAKSSAKKKPFYTSLSWQVLFGIAVGGTGASFTVSSQ